MKKILLFGLVLVLILTASAAFAEPEVLSAQGKITVQGRASIKVKPDVAYVSVGVRVDATDAKGAQAQNKELMNGIIDAIKALGIAEKDIKTSDFYMYPQYDYSAGEKVVGYMVSNNVTVTVRDIELASAVIDASVEAGANSASSIEFNVSNPTTYYQQALASAIRDAESKGRAIADALGVVIGLPSEVTEQTDEYYSPRGYGNADSAGMEMSMDSSTPIQSGELEISARLQVTYEY